MPLSISEPVSPFSESGDRSSFDLTEPGLEAQEIISTASQPDDPQTPHLEKPVTSFQFQTSIEFQKSIDFQTSVELHSISETLRWSAAPTDLLLPPQQYERRPCSIYEQLGRWNLIVTYVGSIYALLIMGFLWFLWSGHDEIPFWKSPRSE